ncbi:MAG: DUF6261 family protein [Bacteroidales bacterium]|jgi:uncharacterized protein YukE|nr:DUF6261 family protein [Bacteroidales bacterium]
MTQKDENILAGVIVSQFSNGLHWKYVSETLDLLGKHNPESLGIVPFYEPFKIAIQNEDAAFKYSAKSAETERIAKLDEQFDIAFSGMRNYANAFLKHLGDAERYAAENLKVVFDKYGNITKQSYRQALGLAHNLIQDLRNRHEDVQTINLIPWIDAFEMKEQQLSSLLEKRNEEMSQQTNLRMKETRQETDFYYHKIVNRINAMINLYGKDFVPGFFEEFNQHATEYNNIYAQHIGRIQAGKKEESEEESEEESNNDKSIIDDEL